MMMELYLYMSASYKVIVNIYFIIIIIIIIIHAI